MHFDPEAIACGHGNSKTIPKRRFRPRVGVCCPVPGARARGRSTAQPRFARGVQWTEVDRAHRLRLALHATRPAAVGSCLPADAAMAKGGSVRGDGSRFARTVAPFGRQSLRPDCYHTRLTHPALYSGERLTRWLRRSEAQEGLEGPRRGGHFRTPARLASQPGQRAGARVRGRDGAGRPGRDRRVGGTNLRRPGLHRGASRRRSGGFRHAVGGRKTRGGEERIRVVAAPVGRGAGFRMGIALSAVGEGLREAARHFGGVALRRLRLPLPPAGGRHSQRGFITRSKRVTRILDSWYFPYSSLFNSRRIVRCPVLGSVLLLNTASSGIFLVSSIGVVCIATSELTQGANMLIDATGSAAKHYSPKCVEEVFSKVR